MNEGDYVGFSKDFSEEMKEAMTLQKFVDLKGIEMGEYVAIYFSAKFRNEENVPVEIVFKKDDKTHKVYGLWFPPEIPENNDGPKPKGTLEIIVDWLERNLGVRFVRAVAPFFTIEGYF